LFEKAFIYDSYACRINKGTHLGIKRADSFIRKCSQNYTKDCYALKLNIQGFFMHIDKHILFVKLQDFIKEKYLYSDRD
jgi:RNA-directed DNA polymerase